MKPYILFLLVIVLLQSCKKDNEGNSTPVFVVNSLKNTVEDNSSFSIIEILLNIAGFMNSLATDQPFTLIAPNNLAFHNIGLFPNGSTLGLSTSARDLANYHILPGKVSFKRLPVGDDQEITTIAGNKIYVSKYLDGKDTVITVNGAVLVHSDQEASNGLLQTSSGVLKPENYPNAIAYIRGNQSLVFLSAALTRSGLDISLLSGKETHSIFAPTDAAFMSSQNLGVSTLDSIAIADPAKLADLLKYHILNGRLFQNDLYRRAAANSSKLNMLNGGSILISGDRKIYNNMLLLASGMANPINLNSNLEEGDIPVGNGVVHTINSVLVP